MVVPAIAGVAFHGAWSVLLVSQYAATGLPNDCPVYRAWTEGASIALLSSFFLTTALQIWLLCESMRGGCRLCAVLGVLSCHGNCMAVKPVMQGVLALLVHSYRICAIAEIQ